jgi:hypothetical protein
MRAVFLGADGRTALADYLEHERPADAGPAAAALFLSAASIGSRRTGGRLSPRSINLICEQIGRWHDAEHTDPARHISPLWPHDLRHSFAFALAEATGSDAYELERRRPIFGERALRALGCHAPKSPYLQVEWVSLVALYRDDPWATVGGPARSSPRVIHNAMNCACPARGE